MQWPCLRPPAPPLRARSGQGPTLIEVKTDRYFGHFQGDPESYRPKDEVATLRTKDPLGLLAQLLKAHHMMSDQEQAALTAQAHQKVIGAFEFARASAYPQAQDALADVFAHNHADTRELV